MKVTKYFLGLTCTTTDIKNGNRNRFATAAKFGPSDPIVTFFHSHDVCHLPMQLLLSGTKPFFSVKIKMPITLMAKSTRKYVRRGVTSHSTIAWSPQKGGFWPKKGISSACDRLRPPATACDGGHPLSVCCFLWLFSGGRFGRFILKSVLKRLPAMHALRARRAAAAPRGSPFPPHPPFLSRMPRMALVLGVLVLALLPTTAGGMPCLGKQTQYRQGTAVKVLYFNWWTSEVLNNIMAIILGEVLGYDVEMVQLDNPMDVYRYLYDNQAHVTMEVWAFGKEGEYAKYQSGVEHLDHLSLPASNGWYIPNYVAKEHIEALYYPFFKTPKAEQVFRTSVPLTGSQPQCQNAAYQCAINDTYQPPTCRSPQNCSMQLLHWSPTYAQAQSEQFINNHDLGINVVYLGGNLSRSVWQKYAERQPFLFYWWEPDLALLNLGPKQFERVSLPPYDASCPTTTPSLDGPAICDFPIQKLAKVARSDLDANVRHLAMQFDVNQEDVDWLRTQTFHGTAQRQACQWVRENEDKWRKWVKEVSLLTYFVPNDYTGCWVTVTIQWSLSFVLCLSLQAPVRRFFRRCHVRMWSSISKRLGSRGRKLTECDASAGLKFLSRLRSEEAFVACMCAEPPATSAPINDEVFRHAHVGKTALYWYLLTTGFPFVVIRALASALFAGGLATIVEVGVSNYIFHHGDHLKKWGPVFQSLTFVYAGFLSLPAFFIVIIVNTETQKWLKTVSQCLDLANVWCGLASMLAKAFKEDTEQNRRVLYQFYRYINVAHFHTYRGLNVTFRAVTEDDLVRAGLLTSEETAALQSLGCHGTENVVSWISMLYMQCVHSSQVAPPLLQPTLSVSPHPLTGITSFLTSAA